jgi:hypothetical protein
VEPWKLSTMSTIWFAARSGARENCGFIVKKGERAHA